MDLNWRDLLLAGGSVGAALAAARPASAQGASARVESAATAAEATPTAERPIGIVTLRDLEAQAGKVLSSYAFAYAAGGAGDEWTMRENEAAINRWVIEPNFLSGHLAPDLTASLFGSALAMPILTAPMASHALFHAGAEAATTKGTDDAGSIYVSSSSSSLDLETIAATGAGPKWFQIYFPSDRGYARELLQRAKAAGYKAVVITADATMTSNRERMLRVSGQPVPTRQSGNKPRTPGIDPQKAEIRKLDLNWDDVAFCGSETGLPVIVKSIISVRNVMQVVEHGCAGVWISNHGGRQLDNSPAPFTVLPRIADAVNGRVPIIVDGGIRRGQDVFRALALVARVIQNEG